MMGPGSHNLGGNSVKMLPAPTETDIKLEVKDYLSARGIFSFHLLQGLGAYKGVPDRVAHYQSRVIYLEVKRPGGKLSQGQKEFQEQCLLDGIEYAVITSFEDLVRLFEKMTR